LTFNSSPFIDHAVIICLFNWIFRRKFWPGSGRSALRNV